MKTQIICNRAHVLELKGASGAVGQKIASALARRKNKPVLFRYSCTQINGVQPNGTYQELERETWNREDPSKPFRYLPGKYFSGVEDFDKELTRLS